jgi:hypothetical protein
MPIVLGFVGQARVKGRCVFSANMPYRPTPSLVALFARTGTTILNPRAPHTFKPRSSAAAFSYIDVARLTTEMENGSGSNQRRASSNTADG